MKLAITIAKEAAAQAPFVLRGGYAETIREAARIGYDAVELHAPDPLEVNVEEIRTACEACGVKVCSIGTGLAFVREGITLTSRDESNRLRAHTRLQSFIRLAESLGGVVIIGLIKGQVRDSEDRATYERHLTEALGDSAATARQCGVTLVIEAINRYECDFLNNIQECARFIERFDREHVKLHIDTFHMNIEEDDIGGNILAAGSRIGHVHVADSNRGYPGSGHYDFAETIYALREVGYHGALSVECLGLPTRAEAAWGALRFLRRTIAAG